MTRDLLQLRRSDAEAWEATEERVPEVVEAKPLTVGERGDLVAHFVPPHGATEVPRVERSAIASREDPLVSGLPGRVQPGTQLVQKKRDRPHVPAPCGAHLQAFVTVGGVRAAHGDESARHVHVLPPQPDQLTKPQSREREFGERALSERMERGD